MKELKVVRVTPSQYRRVRWNPVKELKEHISEVVNIGEGVSVESGEGIEREVENYQSGH